jgi:hypothetical protein
LYTKADPENEKTDIRCNVWGNLRAIKNIKNFKFIATDVVGHEKHYCYLEDYLFYKQMQKYGNFLTIKRNLYDFNRRDNSASSMDDEKLKIHQLTYEVVDEFIKQNKLIGKSIKTWEKDLYDDANSFLMSGFNFNSKSQIINFFTNSNNNFDNLYKLYYDKQLIINKIDNDFEYCVINACNYNVEEIKEIFKKIKNKKPLEVTIYINEYNKTIETDKIENLIFTYLSNTFFWSTHSCFKYFIINAL